MRGILWWIDRVGRFLNYNVPDGDTAEEQIERFRQERTPEPFPTELPAMLEELERQFADNPHWTGAGPITRPIVLMARIVAELARQHGDRPWNDMSPDEFRAWCEKRGVVIAEARK